MDFQQFDWTGVSYEEARATLKKWREDHVRRPEEVVEIWEYVLSRYSSSLKEELWSILEQVCIAALDQSRMDLAIYCLQVLGKQFPSSSRVTKLQAMRLESIGDWEGAEHLYDKLIEADETNLTYRKRKIAILIAQGNRQEAIRQLIEHLESFVSDPEAWMQLSQMFLQEGDYSRASFCSEEVLLTNPHSPVFLQKMAEIRYTQGGPENIEFARCYYERSISLLPTLAALYGLILCCNHLHPKSTGHRKRELISTGIRACNKLALMYEENLAAAEENTNGGNGNGNGGATIANPTIGRQLAVIELLKSHFKE